MTHMSRILILGALLTLTACGSGDSKTDDTSTDAASSGASCNLGSDCPADEFCLFDYRGEDSPDEGSCIALPDECEGPTSCTECPELQDAACPESFTTACSDSSTDANPIFSCN